MSKVIYKTGDKIIVNDLMQKGYAYVLSKPVGKDFDPEFSPHCTPKEMMALGVFEGKYCNDCTDELPGDWFENAKTSKTSNPELNYFGVKSRQSLKVWQEKGWIIGPDPRGWFQWYCRYYLGRRIEKTDQAQIRRWKSFARHAGQIRANCDRGDLSCRPRQRQALLQWAHDPFI
ncbi:MAG: hypothetical protein V6Z81_03705 [Parvularculales bacterium]